MSRHFLSQMAQRLALRLAAATQAPARAADPIDHPDIAAMDLRKIADLPLAPPRPRTEASRAEPVTARKAA
jgi:hypothetical protein